MKATPQNLAYFFLLSSLVLFSHEVFAQISMPTAPPAPNMSGLQNSVNNAQSNLNSGTTQGSSAPGGLQNEIKSGMQKVKVNLNTASEEDLAKLPGIGPTKAKAIVAGRPYNEPKDVMKVPGIKQGVYKKIKNLITTR